MVSIGWYSIVKLNIRRMPYSAGDPDPPMNAYLSTALGRSMTSCTYYYAPRSPQATSAASGGVSAISKTTDSRSDPSCFLKRFYQGSWRPFGLRFCMPFSACGREDLRAMFVTRKPCGGAPRVLSNLPPMLACYIHAKQASIIHVPEGAVRLCSPVYFLVSLGFGQPSWHADRARSN